MLKFIIVNNMMATENAAKIFLTLPIKRTKKIKTYTISSPCKCK